MCWLRVSSTVPSAVFRYESQGDEIVPGVSPEYPEISALTGSLPSALALALVIGFWAQGRLAGAGGICFLVRGLLALNCAVGDVFEAAVDVEAGIITRGALDFTREV